MRPAIVYYALLLVAVSGAAAASPFAGASVGPAILGNGLKVIALEDHTVDLVAVEVWVKAGVIDETRANNGAAHFVEHLLFKGAGGGSSGQADREMESLGATLEASTSRDSIRVHTVVASRYFEQALKTLTDVTMRAKLNAGDMERERAVILDEIARRETDPLLRVVGLVTRLSFSDHPYGFPIEGSAANVASMSVDTVRDFYQAHFVPNNMVVIVAGDVNAAKAIGAVRAAFEGFKRRDLPPLQREPRTWPAETRKEKATVASKLAYCAIGFAAPGSADMEDVYATDVLLQYLVAGHNSWMETNLKSSKGPLQIVSGEFTTRKDPGTLNLMFAADAGDVDQVREAIFAKLSSLKDTPLPEADVDRAKRSVESSFAFESETFSGKAHSLGFYETLGDYKLALTYAGSIRSVTPERIRQVVAKYINTNACVIAEVGP